MNIKTVGFVGSAFLVILIIILSVDYFWQEDESVSKPISIGDDENNNVDNAKERHEEEKPGFEAVFAVAGLLAIAYLVLRQRE